MGLFTERETNNKEETVLRAALVISLISLLTMTFEYFEKDRVYKEYITSSMKTIDSLQNEINTQEIVGGHFNYMWEQMKELHPKDAEKIEHETE
jgi:hypothetical protein